MNDIELFRQKQKEFLSFLKARYLVFHASNVFFRDLHYGVMTFLELNGRKHPYSTTEQLTEKVVASLVEQGILLKVANQAYVLNYPEFRKPPVKPAAPVKPAPAALARPAAPRPAAPATTPAKVPPAAPVGEADTKS